MFESGGDVDALAQSGGGMLEGLLGGTGLFDGVSASASEAVASAQNTVAAAQDTVGKSGSKMPLIKSWLR